MRQIDLVRASSAKFDEALEEAYREAAGKGLGGAAAGLDLPAEAVRGTRPVTTLPSREAVEAYSTIEAIILGELRPAYFIANDRIVVDGDYDHLDVLTANKQALEAVATGVGRVDLIRHPTLPYAGTGWLIDDDIVVTNRHVAETFAEASWAGGHTFARGVFDEPMEARVDTIRQIDADDVGERTVEVTGILYVAGPREPDIAFLRVVPRPDLPKLDLSTTPVAPGLPVAAIGYPAWDGGRNDPDLMERLFKGVYNVKRFSPGLVHRTGHDDILVLGDYTSLGGNSGSAVVDLATGKVVGLHFAGVFRDTNYAVAADVVAAARLSLDTKVPGHAFEEEPPATAPEAFAGRGGYDPHFLGCGALAVPLPALGARRDDLAPVAGEEAGHLKYTHFTVLQSASRRLPMLTAVNIDGERAFRLKRRGSWRLDGRLKDDHQIGNELYRSNPLDRGHMVRRRDPGWGESREVAQQGEIDTFHYTNCAPQHAGLNQRDWVGLEDYILEAAETLDFRATVFTGPVFRDTDRRLMSQPGAQDVAIPKEFWKIAVMVNAVSGTLSATGYVLSHGPLIRDLLEAAFVFGAYRTYQVKITRIEAATGFDFGRLRDADPLAAEPEAVFGRSALRIDGPGSLRL